jgi:uncharacterized RDD family membrane protein YckC
MADDQQQPGQPPAGAPGSWPPPAPDPNVFAPQPGFAPPPAGAPAGWQPQGQQPPWGQQPQPPAWVRQPQQPPPWGQAPGPMPGYTPPAPGGYPPPPYGAPGGFPPPGYGYGPNFAGFWIRFVAFVIDLFIWGFALLVSLISIAILVGLVLFPVVLFGYFPFLWWKRGGTLGQTLLGLRVVRAIDGGPIDGGMAGIRALVFYAESFFGPIGTLGFIWAAFEPRKRAWHDMAAGTVVIQVN